MPGEYIPNYIEITPDMVEAGVLELRNHIFGEDLSEIVTDVFIAMLAARELPEDK